VWTGLICLRIGTGWGGGFCECADEFSGSIKCREFIDWLRLASEEDTVPLSK